MEIPRTTQDFNLDLKFSPLETQFPTETITNWNTTKIFLARYKKLVDDCIWDMRKQVCQPKR